MRALDIWRFIAIFLMISASLSVSGLDEPTAVMATDDGERENDEDQDDDRDQNEEKEEEKQDKKEEKEEEKREKEDEKQDKKDKVTETVPYIVQIGCAFDETANATTCIFTAVAPDGATKVDHLDLPEDNVCTEVTGGDYEYVDPDPDTQVTGYQSPKKDRPMTLVLDGEVTTGGTATFWISTKDGVFPATGPGLSCDLPASDLSFTEATEAPQATTAASSATESPTPTEVPTETPVTTGELAVITYSCADVPTDTTSFDWFGACDPGAAGQTFTLVNVDGSTTEPLATETGESSEATFESLEPGTWQLDSVDADWCHAKSDSVNADSGLVIEAGQTTSVWIFTCEDGTLK